MRGRNAVFEDEMKAVREIQGASKFDPYYVYLIGRAYSRAGRVKETAQQVDIVKSSLGDVLALSGLGRSNRTDQADFYMLKGEVEVAQKRYGEAEGQSSGAKNTIKISPAKFDHGIFGDKEGPPVRTRIQS